MKHAYLIIAHNEFDVLKELIKAIDYIDNDIYIHFDKKVAIIPELTTKYSPIFVIKDRIDARWGCVSLIETEYKLFETAYATDTKYSYYHLISGVHFPLKSQNDIHAFFNGIKGKSVLAPLPWDIDEIRKKIGRYHFFVSGVYSNNKYVSTINNILWRICLKLQGNMYIRKIDIFAGKYSEWVSISQNDMPIILRNKKDVLKSFKYTLCSDELFIPYIYKKEHISFLEQDLLYQVFEKASPKILSNSDYQVIIESKALFARKFNKTSMQLLKRIHDSWKNNSLPDTHS